MTIITAPNTLFCQWYGMNLATFSMISMYWISLIYPAVFYDRTVTSAHKYIVCFSSQLQLTFFSFSHNLPEQNTQSAKDTISSKSIWYSININRLSSIYRYHQRSFTTIKILNYQKIWFNLPMIFCSTRTRHLMDQSPQPQLSQGASFLNGRKILLSSKYSTIPDSVSHHAN